MFKLICSILFVLHYSECREIRFDYKYNEEVDGYFKFNIVPATWSDAELRCLYEGAELAAPTDAKMLKAIKEGWAKVLKSHAGVWSGVHATYSKGDYFSVGGVPLARMPITWSANEPDNYNNCEDCLVMLANGTFADVPCDQTFPYSCFTRKTGLITACGTTDSDYNFNKRTGSCYKFHKGGLSWSRAFMTCAAEGGYLAIIDTYGERDVLKDIFNSYSKKSFYGAKNMDWAFVGCSDLTQSGTWTTIHGQKLEDLVAEGKGMWAGGQPSNDTDSMGIGQSCCTIWNQSGAYDDGFCYEPHVFICEKSPESLLTIN